jgi:hypothetical protein
MRNIVRWFFVFVLLMVCRLGVGQGVFSVRGVVVDATGAAVPGATVRLERAGGDVVTSAHTDANGNFSLLNVGSGDFLVAVPAFSGFGAQSVAVKVNGNLASIRIALEAEAVAQEVTVSSQALSVDAAENKDAVAVSSAELEKMPVFDQDYIGALLPFMDAASGASGGVTLVVDGIEVKSAGVSASAIQEVRVNNDPYASEFNRPGRGRIEIITKPGSQEFHGEANFLFRDAIFNAKNYFAPVRPPEVRRIFEGHVTGPVVGKHTSFVASVQYRNQDTAAVVNAIGPNGPIVENVLTPNTDQQYSLRVNHDFSTGHRLQVGYTFQGSNSINNGVGGITLPEAGTNQNAREDDLLFNDRIIFSPTLINQLMVMFEKDEDVTQSVTNAQSIQVSGSFIGGGAQADVSRTENTIHVNEVVTWSHKKHYIRFGVQLPQFSRRAVDDHTNRLGTFKFSSIDDYNAANPYVFTASQGTGRGLYWINEFGAFFQDQVKVNAHLQLSLGLRYDWQTFVPDNNNLAPRVSVAWAPGKGKTIFRTGTGIFYDRTGGDFPANVVLHDGVVLHTVQIQNPRFPVVGSGGTTLPSNIVRFAQGLRAPYSLQYSVGVERQVHKSVTVSATYRGQVGIKSFRSRDANAPILPANPDLGAKYPRPDLNYGQIQQIESGGRTLMNALDLGFRGKAGRWFAGQAQYTVSRFEGNTGGIGWFPQDQYRPNAEWGRDRQDRLAQLNLMGTINQDHWLSLGVNARLYSGLPYNVTTGDDYYHTGLGNARPTGVARNTRQSGGVAALDLLYDHDFYLTKKHDDGAKVLSAGVSAFNVLNRTNFTNYIGTTSSSRFGEPTGASPGRQIQFSVGFRF